MVVISRLQCHQICCRLFVYSWAHVSRSRFSREAVLGHVSKLVKEFVYQACLRKNLSESAARMAGGKIFTFGSYRLGAHGPGSDIDTLIVAPKHVDRQDFNEIFVNLLQNDDWVTEANVRSNPLDCVYLLSNGTFTHRLYQMHMSLSSLLRYKESLLTSHSLD